MKDWNEAHNKGVDIRAYADQAKPYIIPKLNGAAKLNDAADKNGGPHLVIRCTADIQPEPIDWIWEGRIARGKLTVIGGDPEEGKSQIGVYISATISKGAIWPNHEGQAPLGSVIILSAEDGAEDTLVPRLIAADADRSKIHLVEAVREADEKGRRTFNLQTDLQLLEEKIAELAMWLPSLLTRQAPIWARTSTFIMTSPCAACWRLWPRWQTGLASPSYQSCTSTRGTAKSALR